MFSVSNSRARAFESASSRSAGVYGTAGLGVGHEVARSLARRQVLGQLKQAILGLRDRPGLARLGAIRSPRRAANPCRPRRSPGGRSSRARSPRTDRARARAASPRSLSMTRAAESGVTSLRVRRPGHRVGGVRVGRPGPRRAGSGARGRTSASAGEARRASARHHVPPARRTSRGRRDAATARSVSRRPIDRAGAARSIGRSRVRGFGGATPRRSRGKPWRRDAASATVAFDQRHCSCLPVLVQRVSGSHMATARQMRGGGVRTPAVPSTPESWARTPTFVSRPSYRSPRALSGLFPKAYEPVTLH